MLKYSFPFLLGIIVCSGVSLLALEGLNESWKQKAYDHGCGVWRFKAYDNSPAYFQWMDEFLKEEKQKRSLKYYPPSTPNPLSRI